MIIKRPRVKTMAGSDSTIKIGLRTILMTASSKPARIMSSSLLLVVMSLLKKLAAIQSPREQTSQRVANL